LEIAAGPADPVDAERLQAALPAILARARRERESAPPPTTWDVLLPLTRRWLPALVAAAASLGLLAFLWAQPASGDPWEASLLTQAADEESRRIIANAQSDADEIRRGADEYAVSVLVGLEGDVVKTLQSIKKGIAMLDERRSELIDGRTPSNGVADEEAWEGEGEAEPARR